MNNTHTSKGAHDATKTASKVHAPGNSQHASAAPKAQPAKPGAAPQAAPKAPAKTAQSPGASKVGNVPPMVAANGDDDAMSKPQQP